MTDDPMKLEDHGETVAFLERALPRVAPPDDLFDRVLERIDPAAPGEVAPGFEAPAGEGGTVVPFRARGDKWRAVGIAAGAAAVAAAASVAITLAVSGGDDLGDPSVQAAIAPVLSSSRVIGDVELYEPTTAGGKVVVSLQNVPAPPAGHHYEIWVLPEGAGVMISVGTFTPKSSSVTLELSLPAPGSYAAVDISIEENDGPAEHSGTSLAGGKLT